MEKDAEASQERICRACQEAYRYPTLKSAATRFYCAQCMELPPAVRATFEKYGRRLRQLSAELEPWQRRRGRSGPDE